MKTLVMITMLALPTELIARDTGPRAAVTPEIPAGATIQAFLENDLASNRVHAGDTVIATLPSDLYAGDYLVAAAGARVYGRVTYAASARETRDKGVIALQFDALERSPGEFLAIRAPVSSAEADAKAEAEEARADAIMIVGGAILGGVIGNQVEKKEIRQAAAEAQHQEQIGIAEVIQMAQSHVNDSVIITKIRTSGTIFHLSAQDVLTLKQNGVSDVVPATPT